MHVLFWFLRDVHTERSAIFQVSSVSKGKRALEFRSRNCVVVRTNRTKTKNISNSKSHCEFRVHFLFKHVPETVHFGRIFSMIKQFVFCFHHYKLRRTHFTNSFRILNWYIVKREKTATKSLKLRVFVFSSLFSCCFIFISIY